MNRKLEDAIERTLFAGRWLLTPFYLGLLLIIIVLLVVFMRELFEILVQIFTIPGDEAILGVLSLIDVSLAANLVLIIVLAGYESFVSKIDTATESERPDWMGKVGFSGLKLKLYASIVAISGIELLKAMMEIRQHPQSEFNLFWLTIIHLTFVATTLLYAVTDYLSAKSPKH